ncbi:MAG: hypothetical protein IPP40_15645 [bacterium]|nr:hypothetical protein [bacterium]
MDSLNGAGPCKALATLDNILLAATGPNGLLVADISNREAPVELGHISLGESCTDVKVKDDLAYVTFSDYGMVVYSLAPEQMPMELSTLSARNGYEHIDLGEGLALLSDRWYSIIIDITNPSMPILLDTLWSEEGYGFIFDDVSLSGNVLYGLNWEGMKTFDISNPAEPVQISTYPFQNATAVCVEGNRAYVTESTYPIGQRILMTLDVSTPSQPTLLNSYVFSTDTVSPPVVVNLDYRDGLLLARESYGVRGFDVREIQDPSVRAFYTIMELTV